MLRTLKEELGERRIPSLVVHAGHLQTFTVSGNSTRFQNIIPALRISMDSEGATFAQGAAHTEFAIAELVTLATVDEEVGLGTDSFWRGLARVTKGLLPRTTCCLPSSVMLSLRCISLALPLYFPLSGKWQAKLFALLTN